MILPTGMTLESSQIYQIEQCKVIDPALKINDNVQSVAESLRKNHQAYFGIPKLVPNNLKFRQSLYSDAATNTSYQMALKHVCANDILFFVNLFGWVFEPRIPCALPFVTFPFQDRILVTMRDNFGKRDVCIEKSRDLGMTWMAMILFVHSWLFDYHSVLGAVTRTEQMCYKTDDPDTLFWKLEFIIKHLPFWMRPEYRSLKGVLTNLENGSVIHGYSATGDVARGGRKTCFWLDELAFWSPAEGNAAWASTQHVTNCRIAGSTPCGMVGPFPETMRSKKSDAVKLSCHWSQHPEKRKGLYKYDKYTNHIVKLDEQYIYPEDFKFIKDGKIHSPWYDRECSRHPVPQLIAQELDIDYGGSGSPFFGPEMIQDHIDSYARDFKYRGDLDWDPESVDAPAFLQHDSGELFIWNDLQGNKPVGVTDYVIGCDISTGSGGDTATASVASVFKMHTGEKVAELVCAQSEPHIFAKQVAALRIFYGGPQGIAYMCFEQNGPGVNFWKSMADLQPSRVWMRRAETSVRRQYQDKAGWYSNRENKLLLLGEYRRMLAEVKIVNPSRLALEECNHYVFATGGIVTHDSSKVSSTDPSAAMENHGDRVIADALGAMLCREKGTIYNKDKDKDKKVIARIPLGSLAHRQELFNKSQQKSWLN